MTVELIIPKLGMTMKEATITKWIKSEGDWVEKEEVVFEIETEKVNYEVQATKAGYLYILALDKSTLPVATIVGVLFDEKEDYENRATSGFSATVSENADSDEESTVGTAEPSTSQADKSDTVNKKVRATPAAKRIAGEKDIDISTIKGSGPGGRIVKEDILKAAEAKLNEPDKEADKVCEPLLESDVSKTILQTTPIQGIRRIVSDNMYQSLNESAQLTIHTEANAEGMIKLRKRINEGEEKVSFNAILVKIVAMALRVHSNINASIVGDDINLWKQVHIGLAMDVNDALVVPVVRNPDLKSVRSINNDIGVLVQKSKENRLSPDDMANGTFTITSLGFADVDFFTPIIRSPESAILGVGRIINKPVVMEDKVVPGATIGLSLTFDHRIIDGAPAARFLQTISKMIEEPGLMVS